MSKLLEAVSAEVDALTREVRAEERKRCAAAVCHRCRAGEAAERGRDGVWRHGCISCHADRIWALGDDE